MDHKFNINLQPFARELRNNMTKEEKHLWYDFLHDLPARFRRQKILGNYITDFYSAKAKLVIELDGSQYYQKEALEYDAIRTAYLESMGITVIHIPNNEINRNFRGVCEYIDHILSKDLIPSVGSADGTLQSASLTAPLKKGSLFSAQANGSPS